MKKSCFIECYSGAAGDMLIAAFLEALNDNQYFINELNKLSIKNEFEIEIKPIIKKGISSTSFNVIIKKHCHHNHGTTQKSEHHHRGLKEITEIINTSDISDSTKNLALDIFNNLAEAEAKLHGTTTDKVHFHEVGAIDSIVDIVGFAILFTKLNIQSVTLGTVNPGCGIVKCEHGFVPVPAPATLELIKKFKIPLSSQIKIEAETLTPTGAAILGTISTNFNNIPNFKEIHSISYGAGTKDFEEISNTLRITIGYEKKKL
jgi:uncharacterized protein (TIGR00299 family) protein